MPNGPQAPAAPAEGFAELTVDALTPPEGVTEQQMRSRLALWKTLENSFLAQHPNATIQAHQAVYDNSLQMIRSDAAEAFDLSQETDVVREAYGKGLFGQGCLLARRLVERGVPFVEVSLNSTAVGGLGWDTHANNFETVKSLSAELDAGWATLMTELKQRGLLESTTIIWMGEFGRTPKINGAAGRDHFPQAWSCVLAGGGIAGGQVYGRTSADGVYVEENKTSVGQVLATLCAALGVPPDTENMSNSGRPIPIVDDSPIYATLGIIGHYSGQVNDRFEPSHAKFCNRPTMFAGTPRGRSRSRSIDAFRIHNRSCRYLPYRVRATIARRIINRAAPRHRKGAKNSPRHQCSCADAQ